ncbi:hypothetical protein VTO42DRAFT_1911 [Malbranchea cinnamomea]
MKITGVVSALLTVFTLAAALPAPDPISVADLDVGVALERRAFHGRGTVYEQLGAHGSCGEKHSDSDIIVALSNEWMQGQSPAPYCGRKVRAKNKDNGKTIIAKVADTCMGCGKKDLDFSVGAWNKITGGAPWGVFPVEWDWA